MSEIVRSPSRQNLKDVASGDPIAVRNLLKWWMWNDRNGTWSEAIDPLNPNVDMSGLPLVDGGDNWDPMCATRILAEVTYENLKGNRSMRRPYVNRRLVHRIFPNIRTAAVEQAKRAMNRALSYE